MHASSMENMRKCYQQYVAKRVTESDRTFRVLDIGGADVNGSYADIFSKSDFEYFGADIEENNGVSIVLEDPYILPVEDNSFDYVLSGQMLEHCEFFWKSFEEMVRVVRPDGLILLIAPSAGPIHNYPVDCYRFYPDSYRALAKHAGCYLVDVWHDTRGPWNDLVGVFSKSPKTKKDKWLTDKLPAVTINQFDPKDSPPGMDKIQGVVSYLEILEQLHRSLKPNRYLELGVRKGSSLALANCLAVGVDPDSDVKNILGSETEIIQLTSDDFFDLNTHPILEEKPDFVFIDGMHLFENVLRDFMHVERVSGPNTLVVIDDILPNLAVQATRERTTRVWTGDVWKIYDCLANHRPDLQLTLLDTSPSGLLIVGGLKPENRVLWQKYNPIVRKYTSDEMSPPDTILERQDALSPTGNTANRIIDMYRSAKSEGRDFRSLRQMFNKIKHENSNQTPKLSVVVIAYNMSRELPRTLLSLSHKMQRDIKVGDYEIIVVDNGSTKPFDSEACSAIAPNIKIIHHNANGSVSPVGAINRGIREASGKLVGVMIDGARMASPRLLKTALEASRVSPQRAIIGSIALHLGPEVQMKSVHNGYNQDAEDALLETVPWENDGYHLFDISVLAGSSRKGWSALPAETNALFMSKQKWAELGGFDEKFQSAGGGLANLDMWLRACNSPNSDVMLLLGEATFHQFHGGVATNSKVPMWDILHQEYEEIRGFKYEVPDVSFRVFGSVEHNRGQTDN